MEFEVAEDNYGRAVTLLENVRTHGETARMTELEALLGVGRLQRLKGELRRAGHLLARAAKRASERDFVDIQADAVESLAEIFWHRAEFDRSTRFLERLRELANRFQRYDLYTAALLFEARSRVDVGDWDDAERALDEALEAIERLDDPRELAQCLTIRGYLQCCRDELNSATSKLQRAEYLFDAVDDPRGALRATFRIAQLELARGQLERAERRHREGREEFESFDAYFEAARCRQLGGRIAYRRGDLERARRRLSAAVREFEEMGARWECMRAALGLALVCDECGDRAEADQWLDRVLGTDFCSQLGDRFVQEERQELVSRLAERSSPPVEALRPSS
ncbi:MAG: tetratricopeptide repeat protein [Bradymonadaceae bacterium]